MVYQGGRARRCGRARQPCKYVRRRPGRSPGHRSRAHVVQPCSDFHDGDVQSDAAESRRVAAKMTRSRSRRQKKCQSAARIKIQELQLRESCVCEVSAKRLNGAAFIKGIFASSAY